MTLISFDQWLPHRYLDLIAFYSRYNIKEGNTIELRGNEVLVSIVLLERVLIFVSGDLSLVFTLTTTYT